LNSLQDGTVPLEFAHLYNVNREEQIGEVCSEIQHVGVGRPRLKFINAEYGQGKTQTLGMIRHWAVEHGYAASHVVLQSRGTSLADLRSVYGAILRNLWRPGHNHSAMMSVLEVLFARYRSWRATVETRRLRCPLYLLPMQWCSHCFEEGNVERRYLPGFEHLSPMFRRAVSLYRRAAEGRDPDKLTKEMIVRFLEDDLGYRQGLNFVGVWSPMSAAQILNGLREISRILQLSGLKGLVIALDEAEGIPNIGGAGVNNAYSNLAALIGAAQRIEHVYFIYATTPTFFEDVRRHAPSIGREISDLTRMDLCGLERGDFESLTRKVAHLMAIGSNGEIDEAQIIRKGRELAQTESGSVRNFLTSLFAAIN
jgi:hypothetical protein